MKVLFLDDDQNRHNVFRPNAIGCHVDNAFTAQEAIDLLDNNDDYDVVFLDHDLNWETNNQLNDDEEDGRTVARHLSTIKSYSDKTIVIHSLNNVGGLIMKGILEDAGFSNVHYIPFAWKYWGQDESGNWSISS